MADGIDVAAALAAAGDVAYVWDLTTDQLSWSAGAAARLGVPEDAVPSTGAGWTEQVHPDDYEARARLIDRHCRDGAALDIEYRLRVAGGGFIWVHERGAGDPGGDGRIRIIRGVIREIDQRKQGELAAGTLVNYDLLTGLYNRARLRDGLDHGLTRAQRYAEEGGFLRIGLDGLGRINDLYGESVGNDVLVAAVQRIEACVRATDTLGRLGGDHFGVIQIPTTEDELRATAEAVRDSFVESALPTAVGPVALTVSVGAVLFPHFLKTPFAVFDSAERALQAAKRQGPGRVHVYRPTEDERERHRESLIVGETVRAALDEDRIRLAYQPIVDAGTGAVCFRECLLRLIQRDQGLMTAGAFVSVVEGLGMNRMVDRRSLDLCAQVLKDYPDLELTLNVSAFTIDDQSWLRRLKAHVQSEPQIARRIIVEITETAAMNDIDEARRHIAAVRELGCRIALDDFGAGYTSFRDLKALDVDMVKIDGTFVRDVANDSDNQLFIRTLLRVADGFGLTTVAECVESAADAQTLRALGVAMLQGNFLAEPTSVPDAAPSAAELAARAGLGASARAAGASGAASHLSAG